MPKSISSQKKWKIIFFHLDEQGPRWSISKTARKLRISDWTVKHWIRVFRETGDVLEKQGSGRPRKTSCSEDEEMVEMIQNDKELTAKDISRHMKKKGTVVSATTVRRRLKEAGLKFTSPTSKPAISKLHQTQRLRFARQNKNRDWSKVLFTDETTIKLGPRDRKIWKRRGKKVYSRKFKHYPKIHVWGCFSMNGFGKIVLFKENLTGKKLTEIYKEGLLPSIKIFKQHSWTLVEDNDPKHMSKVAESWRENHNIDRLAWTK
jgi:transposase